MEGAENYYVDPADQYVFAGLFTLADLPDLADRLYFILRVLCVTPCDLCS